MSQDSAFRPSGNTVLVVATSSTGTAATNWSTGNMSGCYVSNGSTQPVYIAFGSSLVAAAQPTTSTPALGLAVPSSTAKCFTFGPNTANAGWISVVTSGGSSALVFVTPGIGF